jgi:aspartyl-tRNA(Asn)/glutamyl-tRNA(Gln) amidotransferase subunit A
MSPAKHSRREFIVAGVSVASLLATKRSQAQSSDPFDFDITQAAPMIRSADLSPSELVQSYLNRIAELDPALNAFITLTAEQALNDALRMEQELAAGQWRGPLHGIPIALKDNIDTAGVKTTAASAVYADRIPDEDAEVVTRLKSAGAIILGKLNMHEFAYGATSSVSHFGPVHNPWDLERIPGGSSGGSAAAVAARLCAGALGTDTGGSVRIPAAACGIVGFKPTYGLSSIRGIIPLSVSLDHVGPMCRTVNDAALMLQALAGFDAKDIASIRSEPQNYASAVRLPTSSMRLGIPRDLFFEDVDAQILDAVETAIAVLGGMTKSVQAVELPPLPDGPVVLVEALHYHEKLIEEKRDLYGALTLQRILRGTDQSATKYAELKYQLEMCRKSVANVFVDVDLLITPTIPGLPVRIADMSGSTPTSSLIRNTMPFNAYGIPTISVPCGFSREGLPIGLQISGRALRELDVLALAHAYQRRTDWHERTPKIA